jgi:hypothetical protein
MVDLHSLLTENKQPLKEFGYLLLFVSVLFAMTFIIITSFNLLAYAAAVVSITLIIFVIKRLVAYYFEVRLSSTFWLSGLIFSAVATLFVSALGAPVLVPFLNTTDYKRAKTLRGLKKGEVTVEEKWKISIFSAIIFLAFSMLFFWLNTRYNSQALFASGSFLVIYTFLNLLPYHRFDGAFMFYHNLIMSAIKLMLAFLTMVLVYISFFAGFWSFVVFTVFSLASYRLKLW